MGGMNSATYGEQANPKQSDQDRSGRHDARARWPAGTVIHQGHSTGEGRSAEHGAPVRRRDRGDLESRRGRTSHPKPNQRRQGQWGNRRILHLGTDCQALCHRCQDPPLLHMFGSRGWRPAVHVYDHAACRGRSHAMGRRSPAERHQENRPLDARLSEY